MPNITTNHAIIYTNFTNLEGLENISIVSLDTNKQPLLKRNPKAFSSSTHLFIVIIFFISTYSVFPSSTAISFTFLAHIGCLADGFSIAHFTVFELKFYCTGNIRNLALYIL